MYSELESRSSVFSSRSGSNGLPSPSPSAGSDQSQHYTKNNIITVDLTGYAQLVPERSCAIGAALEPTPEYSPPTIDITASVTDMAIKDAGTCTGAVCGMDAQAAINFILKYVSRCICPTISLLIVNATALSVPASRMSSLTCTMRPPTPSVRPCSILAIATRAQRLPQSSNHISTLILPVLLSKSQCQRSRGCSKAAEAYPLVLR